MNEYFEKILQKLEKEIAGKPTSQEYDNGIHTAYKIVQEVTKEYQENCVSCNAETEIEAIKLLKQYQDLSAGAYKKAHQTAIQALENQIKLKEIINTPTLFAEKFDRIHKIYNILESDEKK